MKMYRWMVVGAAALLSMGGVTSCAEAEDEFLHKDSRILNIEIQPAGGGAQIAGVIDETTGQIFFPIPKAMRDKYDITSLMVRANVQFDAMIYPPLTGLKDLSDPMEITVTAGDQGSRTYSLWAFYTRR